MKTKVLLICFLLTLISCIRDILTPPDLKLPTVTTNPISVFTWDYAVAGGVVTDDGGSPITSRGLCVTINRIYLPTVINNGDNWFTIDSSGLGIFSDTMKLKWGGAGHTIRQTHYIRAYATNKKGTAYGEVLTVYPKSKPPKFYTLSLVGVTTTTAILKFGLHNPPETFEIDELDVCISSNPNPTIEGTHFPVQLNEDNKNDTLNNLAPNTTYYIRGYVKNESGFAYSPEISITTWEGSLSDIVGNIYPTKTIGSKVWMTKDLTTVKFNDGTIVPNIQDNLEWSSTTTSASCTYTSFGKLYNYFAVIDTRNLCPTGWHVPTDSEWSAMEISLGMSPDQATTTGYRGTEEGGKLKFSILDIGVWKVPNTGATNSSGFSAQGGGFRYDNGILTNSTISANYWTSSEFDVTSAWSRSLSYNSAQISRLSINKKYGFSVRCVKD